MKNINLLNDIRIRDPFILADEKSKNYYLYYTMNRNLMCFESKDLINWTDKGVIYKNDGTYNTNWAPEVHFYKGNYYWFASLSKSDGKRGCYILRSKTPTGPFIMHSKRLTREDWSCIDATLFVDEKGIPYTVYCHEYVDFKNKNGEMRAVRLKDDLSGTNGVDVLLFRGSDNKFSTDGVTDAPFIYKPNNSDKIIMTWSKYNNSVYSILAAVSQNGIFGPWKQQTTPVFKNDGGHGMVFTDFEGNLRMSLHVPNNPPGDERVAVAYFDPTDVNNVKADLR